jgi:hypothetical protein
MYKDIQSLKSRVVYAVFNLNQFIIYQCALCPTDQCGGLVHVRSTRSRVRILYCLHLSVDMAYTFLSLMFSFFMGRSYYLKFF